MIQPAQVRARANAVLHRVREGLFHRHWSWPRLRRSPRPAVEIEPPAPGLVKSFARMAKWSAIFSLLVGYHVLMGWVFNIGVLLSPWYTFSAMKVNEAVCAICGGIGLLIVLKTPAPAGRNQALVLICGGIVTLISLVTLLEHALELNLGIDELLFRLPAEYGLTSTAPGRMAATSALGFLLTGVALGLIGMSRGVLAAQALALISATISLLAIVSYMYAAQSFPGQMPLYGAIATLLLGIGLVGARADRGVMAQLTSDSFGGLMARRLIPAALLAPIILGWLERQGQKAGWYPPEPGLALLACANVLVFATVIWRGVNSLHRMDMVRRQVEVRLQDTAAKLARSNADLEQFAYVASHDLKEPLRAISGSVQILQESLHGRLEPSEEEVIRHTVGGANRMQTLIDDLLTYSRLTTREEPLEDTDAGDVLQEVIANLRAQIEESKAVITYDPLPLVQADRTQLLQVFQNLVSNGIKYRSVRTPKVHIGVEDQDDQWRFSVRDNGIGIGPQYRDRIFRIFQRLHTRQQYAGTGIGLAVCKKIVERHGGRIWVESEPDEGATFYFTIPKREAP